MLNKQENNMHPIQFMSLGKFFLKSNVVLSWIQKQSGSEYMSTYECVDTFTDPSWSLLL